MPTITRLQDAGAESIPLAFANETLTITVATGRMTASWSDRFQQSAEDQDTDAMVALFSEVVTAWDLFERDPHDGEDPADVPVVPITMAAMLELPVALWARLGEALRAKMSPPEPTATGSFGG